MTAVDTQTCLKSTDETTQENVQKRNTERVGGLRGITQWLSTHSFSQTPFQGIWSSWVIHVSINWPSSLRNPTRNPRTLRGETLKSLFLNDGSTFFSGPQELSGKKTPFPALLLKWIASFLFSLRENSGRNPILGGVTYAQCKLTSFHDPLAKWWPESSSSVCRQAFPFPYSEAFFVPSLGEVGFHRFLFTSIFLGCSKSGIADMAMMLVNYSSLKTFLPIFRVHLCFYFW